MKFMILKPCAKALGFFIFLFTLSGIAQTTLTAEEWRQDLDFLHTAVHNDYPFLFKKISAADWDAKVKDLHSAIPQMEQHEILIGLTKLVASFEYGHTLLSLRQNQVPLHRLPLVLYHFDDGIYITGVQKNYKNLLGARIISIEDMPIEKVLERVRPVIPAENDQFVKGYGINYPTIPEVLHAQGVTGELKLELSLQLEKDGKMFEEIITAMPWEEIPRQYGMIVPGKRWAGVRDVSSTPLYLKDLDKIYYFEYLPEQKTVYVRHSQIQDQEGEDIPTFYARLFDFIENNEVEKLILDVRLNGGGNNYKNKPIVTGIIANKKINQPGKFMVIIGRRTFSACQNLVNELHTYTNAIFVGEPTGENLNFYGDNRPVTLPNSEINAYLSFAWWQDKPQWENRPWLAPQIATGMTFEQYRSNQDPALEAALAFDNPDFITDPMAHLTRLYTAGKFEEVQSEALRMVKDPAYKFYDFEGEFNSAGYQLLDANDLEGAIGVFGMNTEFFPDSANTWDSLAEAYWRAGDKLKAEEYYNKAIGMDPDGAVGANAKEMLKNMKSE
ncbi:MAG: S41 family peptidase [Flavobacteriaceae bacterium]